MTHRATTKTRFSGQWRSAAITLLLAPALLAAAVSAAAAAADAPAASQVTPGWYGDPAAPDLSGVWVRTDATPEGAGAMLGKEGWKPWKPPLKGEFAATWNKRIKDEASGQRADEPFHRCLPPGMPRFMTGMTGPLLIMQTPGRVTMYRDGGPTRRIWLGRTLPKLADREDFYNGNNVGHYEGNVLVTEVAGIKLLPVDSTGIPHSDQLVIQERIHRVDATTLQVDITLRDPKAYSKPLTNTVTYHPYGDPLWEPHEFICMPEKNFHADMYIH